MTYQRFHHEVSGRLREHFVFPNAGFVPFPDTHGYIDFARHLLEYLGRTHQYDSSVSPGDSVDSRIPTEIPR